MTIKIICFSLLIAIAIFVLLALKHHSKRVPDRHFISGTYVAQEHNHFCWCWDTLVISSYKAQRNIFRIKRTTCYERRLSDSTFPDQTEREGWRGVYDDSSHTLSGFTADYRLQYYPEIEAIILSGVLYLRTTETIHVNFPSTK